jgi:hypothetical protein
MYNGGLVADRIKALKQGGVSREALQSVAKWKKSSREGWHFARLNFFGRFSQLYFTINAFASREHFE